MPRRDLSQLDASDRASSELEYVIHSQKRTTEPSVPSVSVSDAMKGDKVYKSTSNRDVTRVLFISRNTELLNPTRQSLDGFVDISDLFDEVHILILRKGISPKNPVLRVAKNVWIYTASSKSWWKTLSSGVEMAEKELQFANGFRPDLIVARDPFESAMVANTLGKKYDRPTQLHVVEDYSTSNFLLKDVDNYWRLFLPFFTIPRFESVRVLTESIRKRLENNFTIPDLDVLPRYQNYEAMIDSQEKIDLKEKYKPFVFFILFIGKLGTESSLHKILDSAQGILRNPRVGLIVLGEGSCRSEFQKRAKTLGIEAQVVFETRASQILPYLKSANMLIIGDTGSESEEVVLKGAASGIPMIMSQTDKRTDVFTDGESAFILKVDDVESMTDKINDLLNNFSLRRQFVINAQDIIRDNFHHDPKEYLVAYRDSIEQAFFVNDDSVSD
jgi:glycosyltransferase involved in cell wall biosynthesis